MAWNGLGTYVLNPAYSPEVNGTTIDAVRYNGLTTDLAVGISACINKNGENVPTAAISWGGQRLTNLGTPSAAGDALSYGAEATVGNLWFGNTTTSAGNIGIGPTTGQGSRAVFWGDAAAGAGSIVFVTGSSQQLVIPKLASAVNYLQLSGNLTANRPGIFGLGSDTNVGLALAAKGTGDIYLGSTAGAALLVNNLLVQDRAVTITASNGGNPIIGTTAGHLKGTSALREIGAATTANDVAEDYTLLGSDKLCFVDKDQPANGRQTELFYTGGTLVGRFVNDAYNAATNWLSVTGSSAAIAGITFGGPIAAPAFSGTPTGTITSGTYVPTVTNSANCTSLSVVSWQYQRIGDIVTVQGWMGVGCTTAAGTASAFYATLPIASTLSTSTLLTGVGNRANTASTDGLIAVADTVGNRANFAFLCTAVNAATTAISFSYKVV